MNQDELLLSQRLANAVDGVRPDTGRLVERGAIEGHTAIRRRRIRGGGLAAATLVVAAALGFGHPSLSLIGLDEAVPVDRPHPSQGTDRVTPQGLAALLDTYVDKGLVLVEASGLVEGADVASDSGFTGETSGLSVTGFLRYEDAAGSSHLVEVGVMTRGDSMELECLPTDQPPCSKETLPDGTEILTSQNSDFHSVMAIRSHVIVKVVVDQPGEPPLFDQRELERIASDPRIGLTLAPDWDEAGRRLQPWVNDWNEVLQHQADARAN